MAKKVITNQLLILLATCILVVVFFYHSTCWVKTKEAFENSKNAVSFYQNCGDDKGLYYMANADKYNEFNFSGTPLGTKTLSSIKIPPTAKVTLYDGRSFKGNTISLTSKSDTDCLSTVGWEKRAQSVTVEPLVTFYPECEFQGAPSGFDVGFHTVGNNFTFKSVRIPENHGLVLYDGIGGNSQMKVLEGPQDMYCTTSLPYNSTSDWGQKVRSFKIAKLAMFFEETKYRKKLTSIDITSTTPQPVSGMLRSARIPPGYQALVFYSKEAAEKKQQPAAIFVRAQPTITIPKPRGVAPKDFVVYVVFETNWLGDDSKGVDAELRKWKW